jgi:hypothetical protein
MVVAVLAETVTLEEVAEALALAEAAVMDLEVVAALVLTDTEEIAVDLILMVVPLPIFPTPPTMQMPAKRAKTILRVVLLVCLGVPL